MSDLYNHSPTEIVEYLLPALPSADADIEQLQAELEATRADLCNVNSQLNDLLDAIEFILSHGTFDVDFTAHVGKFTQISRYRAE